MIVPRGYDNSVERLCLVSKVSTDFKMITNLDTLVDRSFNVIVA